MSETVHYIPFAAEYQRLLPPLTQTDDPPDRVVLVHQPLSEADEDAVRDLQHKFETRLADRDATIQVEREEVDLPYEFDSCFQTAYRTLREELENGHDVHVNAASIPELVGISYVSATRMLAAELRNSDSLIHDIDPKEVSITTYYSAPDSFPALQFLTHRENLRRINESLGDLDSLDEHVQMDREFADLVLTLFDDDNISVFIEALESVTTERDESPQLDDLRMGLRDVRDGLEQFADGINTIARTDVPDPTEHPELLAQLLPQLWNIDGIDFDPATFETLQDGAKRLGDDPESIFNYFDDRMREVETVVEKGNPLEKTELQELIDASERVASHGLTSGHRTFDDGTPAVVLPTDLDPDLSSFQHSIVYTLGVADDDVDSITELAHGLLEFATEDPSIAASGIEWTRPRLEYSLPHVRDSGDGEDNQNGWAETLRDKVDSGDDIDDNVVPSLRSKVQYNLTNTLVPAGFVEWVESDDTRASSPRLTTAGQYWAKVHYDPLGTQDNL